MWWRVYLYDCGQRFVDVLQRFAFSRRISLHYTNNPLSFGSFFLPFFLSFSYSHLFPSMFFLPSNNFSLDRFYIQIISRVFSIHEKHPFFVVFTQPSLRVGRDRRFFVSLSIFCILVVTVDGCDIGRVSLPTYNRLYRCPIFRSTPFLFFSSPSILWLASTCAIHFFLRALTHSRSSPTNIRHCIWVYARMHTSVCIILFRGVVNHSHNRCNPFTFTPHQSTANRRSSHSTWDEYIFKMEFYQVSSHANIFQSSAPASHHSFKRVCINTN